MSIYHILLNVDIINIFFYSENVIETKLRYLRMMYNNSGNLGPKQLSHLSCYFHGHACGAVQINMC